MRPAAFELAMPEEVDEALALLEGAGPETLLIAGGQTMIPLLNMRLSTPTRLIDLNRIASLSFIELKGADATIRIGAMTRQREVEWSEALTDSSPLLRYAAGFVGQPHTRSRGTIGGSIALGSTVAELCVALLALGGSVRAFSPLGDRPVDRGRVFVCRPPHDVARSR